MRMIRRKETPISNQFLPKFHSFFFFFFFHSEDIHRLEFIHYTHQGSLAVDATRVPTTMRSGYAWKLHTSTRENFANRVMPGMLTRNIGKRNYSGTYLFQRKKARRSTGLLNQNFVLEMCEFYSEDSFSIHVLICHRLPLFLWNIYCTLW